MTSFDNVSAFFFSGLIHRWPLLDGVGVFFASYAIYLLAGIVFLMLVRANISAKNIAAQLVFFCAVILVPIMVNAMLGVLAFRERPFVALDFEPLIAVAAQSKSFPSDHTAVAFALATLGALSRQRFAVVLFFVAFLVGFWRVYAGVHYPSDILAGALVGSVSAYVMRRFYGTDRRTRV